MNALPAVEKRGLAFPGRRKWTLGHSFNVSVYRLHRTRDGRVIWRKSRDVGTRIPMACLGEFPDYPRDVHNTPVSDDERALLATLQGTDVRPPEMTAEDYHAY